MMQKNLAVNFSVAGLVLLLGGCSTMVFPDFKDDTQVIIDDGGKVEVSKIESKGIIVADKENAAYEDEQGDEAFVQNENVTEEVTPAKVVKVEAEKLDAVVEAEKTTLAKADNEKEIVVAKVEPKEEVIEEALPEVNNVEENNVDTTGNTMHYLAETIYFDNGSSEVDYSFYGSLKKLAKLAKEKNAMISVYGYASSRTRNTDPVNHKLINFNVSVKRAQSVVNVLRKYGVAGDKIVSQAFSDSTPLYQEVMPEGERLNRRVEIYLTY